MNLASTAERREVELALVPDTGAEPPGDVKGEGADGPSSTAETKEEGRLLMENKRALIHNSETTRECTAGGTLSATETEAEEGSSLLEGVTAPSGSSKPAPQCMAGDSSQKSRKRVRLFVGAEEQE